MMLMSRGAVYVVAVAVLAAGCGAADGEKRTDPAPAAKLVAAPPPPDPLTGPDSARTRARIDSVFARFDRPDSPGCLLTVMRAGDIILSRGYGSADLEAGTPIDSTSAFDGASMAKQFLAFSVALLASDGRLSLDDEIHEHLPETPDYGAPVTLRHLVHHTSGIRDWDAIWLSGNPDLHPARLTGLSFAPGTRHSYDDTGYGILEEVVLRITGKPWEAFARERIYGPLGMNSTGRAVEEGPRRVQPYAPREGGGFRTAGQRDRGGFTITAPDLARWDRNFYDARVGGPEVIRMMTTEGRLANGETIPYAMALHTEPYRGLRRLWHGGLAGGYRSQFMRYPDQRTSVLVQCNVYQMAEPNGLAQAVTDIVLEDAIARAEGPPAPPPPAPSADELRRLAALYINRDVPALRPLRFQDGKLQMRQWITWHDLRPLAPNRFRADGLPLTLVFRPGGDGVAGAVEEHWDGTGSPLVLHAVPSAGPSAAELEAYAGRYVSAELGATYNIVRDGPGLRVRAGSGRLPFSQLRPAGPDAFSDYEYVLILFRRDARGRPTSFTVSTPRLQNLVFER